MLAELNVTQGSINGRIADALRRLESLADVLSGPRSQADAQKDGVPVKPQGALYELAESQRVSGVWLSHVEEQIDRLEDALGQRRPGITGNSQAFVYGDANPAVIPVRYATR